VQKEVDTSECVKLSANMLHKRFSKWIALKSFPNLAARILIETEGACSGVRDSLQKPTSHKAKSIAGHFAVSTRGDVGDLGLNGRYHWQ
jgi:hypothetical protein